MPLSDIVNVQITRETQTPSEVGFGTLMILGNHKAFNQRIRYYSSIQEVGQDFPTTSKEYIAAQDVFAQNPRPQRIAIGRRSADSIEVEVITDLENFNYTVNINGQDYNVLSNPIGQDSIIELDADLVDDNLIQVILNGDIIGTVTSILDFDNDFASGDVAVATVNGEGLNGVPFDTNQSTTIGNLAAAIDNLDVVASATVTGARQITVVFANPGNNTVNSVVTTGGNNPTVDINEGGFTYATSHLQTMMAIRDELILQPSVFTAVIEGVDNRTLHVFGTINQSAIINNFDVTMGASQANAAITLEPHEMSKQSIAESLILEINNDATNGVTAALTSDETFSITADTPDFPFTVSVKTDILDPDEARVDVTQVIPGGTYSIKINTVTVNYTAPNNVQSNEQVALGIVQAINDHPQVIPTASDNGDGSFIVSDADEFSISSTQERLQVQFGLRTLDITPSALVQDDLNAIQNSSDDWYCLAYTERDRSTVEEIAEWVESQTKIFGTTSDDPDIIDESVGDDTSSIAYELNSRGYVRTFVMYHQDADSDYPECAWFGRLLPLNPGSATWKFKQLASIAYSDLTTTQSKNARDKNANTYEFVAGVGIAREGTMAQGEYIDVIQGIDWLTATIQQFVYALLVNSNKIPYTNAGITAVEAEVRRALDLGIINDFISDSPQYEVTVPRAEDVPPSDKANRILRNVRFTATLAGAVHAVEISGTVSI